MSDSRFEFVGGARAMPSAEAVFDVVFVHGLTGDHKGTWTHSNGEFWPSWLAVEFPTLNIYSAGYDSSVTGSLRKGAGASLADRATILLDRLSSRVAPDRPIVFVAHSLGGLVVKQMLRKAQDASNERRKRVGRQALSVVFIATPHMGAHLATAMNALLRLATSKSVRELDYAADALIDLGQWFSTWAKNAGVAVECYYEIEKCGGALVVDQVTANPNVHGCDPIAIQADHISITKLENRDSQLYQSLKGVVSELLKKCVLEEGRGSDDGLGDEVASEFAAYTAQAAADRRTLSEKLRDADREHLIPRAERQKERFAMTLQRHIAQPAAVRRYTRLMSDIETRFHRHVSPIIAAKQDAAAVDAALQLNVLDAALKAHDADGADGTPALVDSAFYYLAGNCHVGWDNG